MAKRSRGRTSWIIAGLIAFVLADLALVGYALTVPSQDTNSASAVQPTTGFTTAPSSTSTPVATATPTPTPTATPTATGPAPAPSSTATATAPATPPATGSAAPATLSGMASTTVGYRATAGTCDGDSTATDSVIELTTDGGATWTVVNPTDLRIRAVEKLVVVDASHVDLLARYGDSCTESAISTYTQGEFWQTYPDRTDALK